MPLNMYNFKAPVANAQNVLMQGEIAGHERRQKEKYQNVLSKAYTGEKVDMQGLTGEQMASVQAAVSQASDRDKEGMVQRYNMLSAARRDITPENYSMIAQAIQSQMPDLQVPQSYEQYQAMTPQLDAQLTALGGALGVQPQQPESYTLSPGQQRFTGEQQVASVPAAPKAPAAPLTPQELRAEQLSIESQELQNQQARQKLATTPEVKLTPSETRVESANLSRLNDLSEIASNRQVNIEKAAEFLAEFEKGNAQSGTSRRVMGWVPGVWTDQGKFDEALDAFAEVAARQQLKASGEIRPTDADVKGMKEAMFGVNRDEATNIRLLRDYIRVEGAGQQELETLTNARDAGTLHQLTPQSSVPARQQSGFFQGADVTSASDEDLLNF